MSRYIPVEDARALLRLAGEIHELPNERDARVLHRHGIVLIVGLVTFGAAGIGLFWSTFPRGWGGITRAAILLAVLLVCGGLVAPVVTRALNRR